MDVKKKTVFYNNLTYIYLEMPKFKKTEDELESLFDKWLYALKNLPLLLERPAALQERIFKKFFDVAQTANLSKEEYAKYCESEKIYHDLDGAFRTASQKGFTRGVMKGHAEGHAEGLAEGLTKGRAEGLAEGLTKGLAKGLTKGRDERNLEIARKMKSRGMSFDEIAEMTDLTVDEIEKL